MSLETLTAKYIVSAEKVLGELKQTKGTVSVPEGEVTKVLGWASDYLADAKYYKSEGRFETSLTSVAYCEGLLDALRMLGAVTFEWPANQENKQSS